MTVRFADFEFDAAARELSSPHGTVRLQDQPSQALALLLARAGQVVTREELHQRLWPSKVYFDLDHGLNNAIARLREALGEVREQPRFIQTIPRVGYRFIGTVIQAEPGTPEAAALPPPTLPLPAPSLPPAPLQGAPPRRARARTLAAVGALVAVLVVILWRANAPMATPAVIVLPLANLSADPEQEYFADGMTDAVITALAQIRSLKVISRTTAMHYKKAQEPISQLAQSLHIDAVLEGSVVQAGTRVRINARLIRAADEHPLWAGSFDRELKSVLALQAELAEAVANAVAANITPGERGRLSPVHIPPPAAYDDYLRGMHLYAARTAESEAASIAYFESAIAADPQFASAYAGMSQAYSLLADTWAMGLPKRVAQPRALAAARRAIALDPKLAASWLAVGMLGDLPPDLPPPGVTARRALDLAPGDAWVHKRYADYLLDSNDATAALAEYRLSLRLDPLNPVINSAYGDALRLSGHVEEGLAQMKRTTELDPWALIPRLRLGGAYLEQQHYAEAVREFSKALQISPDSLPAQVCLADALAHEGRTSEAKALLSTIIPLAGTLERPSAVALVQLDLRNRSEALAWLEQTVTARDDTFPVWDEERSGWLHADPAFQALAKRRTALLDQGGTTGGSH